MAEFFTGLVLLVVAKCLDVMWDRFSQRRSRKPPET